jgi:hypothetical protein
VLPTLLAGIALLGTAMTATAVLAPRIALRLTGAQQPEYLVIAGTGVAMIVLSSLFLACACRVIGLGAAWLGLAVLTNGLILVGKFVLVPLAYSQTTFVSTDPFAIVQAPSYFPVLATGVCAVQAGVLALLYALARGRVTRALGPEASAFRRPDLVTALLTAGLALGAPILFFSSLSLVGYAVVVAGATSGAAVVVVLLATGAGAGALLEAARRSISVRDTAIVTSVFWLALSMILVYHVVWVIFMTVLVGLWPLKVVSPSGK